MNWQDQITWTNHADNSLDDRWGIRLGTKMNLTNTQDIMIHHEVSGANETEVYTVQMKGTLGSPTRPRKIQSTGRVYSM